MNRRRSWSDGFSHYYIKTYDYPTRRDQIRGIGRNTLLAPSRPQRELRALNWLREQGFGGPRVMAVVECRQLVHRLAPVLRSGRRQVVARHGFENDEQPYRSSTSRASPSLC